jgi:N-acetylglucosamine kinase-like BadF-type ATPase
MYLIADSGSTKTEWLLLDSAGDTIDAFFTKGFNPNLISTLSIVDELRKTPAFLNAIAKTKKIFFYGSGCSTNELNAVVYDAFRFFSTTTDIEIRNDLFASVHATAGNEPAIVCILGTGSNSCYYDGETVSGDDFSIGYILGDEGSGSYLGKKLLHDYFYHLMPETLQHAFHEKYHLSREELIEKTLRKPRPNEFLGSFTPFLKEHIETPYCMHLVKESFTEFIRYFVVRFPNYSEVPVHFTGSVAANFTKLLTEVANENSIILGKILASPMEELSKFIRNHKLK